MNDYIKTLNLIINIIVIKCHKRVDAIKHTLGGPKKPVRNVQILSFQIRVYTPTIFFNNKVLL